MTPSERALSLIAQCRERKFTYEEISKHTGVSKQYLHLLNNGGIKKPGADLTDKIITGCRILLGNDDSH